PAERQRLLRLGQLTLQLAALVEQRGDARLDILGRGAQQPGSAFQRLLAAHQPAARTLARQRLDAAHARAYRTFGDDAENADVAGRGDVDAAAKLDRIVA